MSNVNLSELRESLKKIRSMNLSMDSYDDLRSKLAVILVKAEVKRVFRQLVNDDLNDLKGIGLKFLISSLPPPYYYEAIKVPLWFLKEYNRLTKIERLPIKCMWFYADDDTYSKIISSLNGDLDDGYILDYPDCCVKWYKKMVTKEIEILHQYIVDRYKLKTQKEVIDALKHSSARFFSHRFVQIAISESLEKTVSKFPFIFHIACPACLKKSNESASLNEKYGQLAFSLEQTLYDEIVEASVEYIKKVGKSRFIFIKKIDQMKKSFPFLWKLETIMKAD